MIQNKGKSIAQYGFIRNGVNFFSTQAFIQLSKEIIHHFVLKFALNLSTASFKGVSYKTILVHDLFCYYVQNKAYEGKVINIIFGLLTM